MTYPFNTRAKVYCRCAGVPVRAVWRGNQQGWVCLACGNVHGPDVQPAPDTLHYDSTDKLLHLLNQAVSDNIDAETADLPPLPDDGRCTYCGSDEFTYIEYGIVRSVTTSLIDGVWWSTTDGYDDYSDEGYTIGVACRQCGELYDTPKEHEWN